MSKKRPAALFKSCRLMILCALFSALSIVLGKLLAVNITNSIRISFENLPVLMAGMMLGPLAGAVVGAIADLAGCMIVGYAINPFITCGAILIGALSGICFYRLPKNRCRILLSVLAAHVVGSMLVKSVGLRIFYSTPYSVLLLRIPIYIVTGLAESAVLAFLYKNPTLRRYFKSADHPNA